MVPMKKMTPMTIMPGARAFIGRVSSPPNAVAPMTPPPAATRTSRNVPQTSLNSRRYSRLVSSNWVSAEAGLGGPTGEPFQDRLALVGLLCGHLTFSSTTFDSAAVAHRFELTGAAIR